MAILYVFGGLLSLLGGILLSSLLVGYILDASFSLYGYRVLVSLINTLRIGGGSFLAR